ncbi:MAG: hypothetical protein ABI389_02140 [Rhodanobacter sp.]
MLEIGNPGMDEPAMERTHMSLWAVLAAPLIAGNDLSTMNAETRTVLTNLEVLAIDQDPLGAQGHRVAQHGPVQLWRRQLADGTLPVGLFNTFDHPLDATLDFKALELPGAAPARDLWQRRSLGNIDSHRVFQIPGHGAVMLKSGTPASPRATKNPRQVQRRPYLAVLSDWFGRRVVMGWSNRYRSLRKKADNYVDKHRQVVIDKMATCSSARPWKSK